ncbi:hypothetical protein [Porphyromonas gulae]|uniref:Uncharacterized protein n=1 Tax=Porphyromonas gulae TaxID=111105 RepID=A0A0A2F204_9PORP|nr:hypothetical protein [Porphyromonas gulae]KGN85053.1 hypothetical protein HR08_07030 [Porphyromonas gulae]
MIYDLSDPLQKEQFKLRCNKLYSEGKTVELTEKTNRTLKQNSYLHLILSYFALQYGESMEFVKREFFKKWVNPETFILEKEDRILGKVKFLRSSAELTQKEMTDCIERFRNWAAKEAYIYLPAPNEHDMLVSMKMEVEKNKKWI